MSAEVMSGVDEVVSNWCQSCEDLRQEIEKLKAEHALNYKALKEKIISTDKLIKRYTAKCQEYDGQTKKLEETSEVLQNYKSDCKSFESQLKTALEELAPLKQNNQRYEKLCIQLEKKLEKSEIKLQAVESSQKQYSIAKSELEKSNDKLKEEKSTVEKRLKEMETATRKNETALKKLQDDLDVKKKEIATIKKENASYKTRAGKLQMQSEYWKELLRSHGLLREGKRMYSRWRRERNSTFKLNDSLESDDEDSLQEFREDVEQGPAHAGGSGDVGVVRQDSLVEMILAEMIQDADPDPFDFSLLTPISPAVSPLRQSPISEDEGPMVTSDEDLNDAAEQLERSVLNTAKKSPGQKGKGKKSSKGKMKVVESTLGPQGVLEMQESLSDTELEGETDLPFTRVGVKTRSNSHSQDDGVFKEPLPVSPLRSRKRRGASVSSLESKSPLLTLNARVTRSSSFPTTVSSPQRPHPVLPLSPVAKKTDNNLDTDAMKENVMLEQNDNKQAAEKSESPARVLRKRKGSLNLSDSDSEDLTIGRRSLRSSSTSSDEGSGEECTRSNRRSPRLGPRSAKVMSPSGRLTRSRRTTEESVASNQNDPKTDSKISKDHAKPSEGSPRDDQRKEVHKTAVSKYKGFVKGGILVPGINKQSEILDSDKTGCNVEKDNHKDSRKSFVNGDMGAASATQETEDIAENELDNSVHNKDQNENRKSESERTVALLESELKDVNRSTEDVNLMKDSLKDTNVMSKVLRRQDSIHSEISSRGSSSFCDADFENDEDDDLESDGDANETAAAADNDDDNEVVNDETDNTEMFGEHQESIDCDDNSTDLPDKSALESNNANNNSDGAKYNSIDTKCQPKLSITEENVSLKSSPLYVKCNSQDVNNLDTGKTASSEQEDKTDFESSSPDLSHQNDIPPVEDNNATEQVKSPPRLVFEDRSEESTPSAGAVSLSRSEKNIMKGVRCKVVTDSSPAFTRLVNQGSTGFVPICAGDLLSPVTPSAYSPNVVPPMSLLRPESQGSTRAESKSSDGSAELQGLMSSQSEGDRREDQSVSPRGSLNSAEVKFYIDGGVKDNSAGEDNIEGRDSNALEQDENDNDNESSIGEDQQNERINIHLDEHSNEAHMEMMDDMSDGQSVLSSLPPSEAGDDERVSPVSSLSTSGSSRSVPLSPLPLSDTESLCDPISPLPPTPERQLLRTPTPIDGTRLSPRPSCSNQPCTPPTPNTPPQAISKERNPVKLLAIKNLQRQLSSEGKEEKIDKNGKLTKGTQGRKRKSIRGQGQKKGQGQSKVKLEDKAVNEVKIQGNAHNPVTCQGNAHNRVKGEGNHHNEVKGQENAQNQVKIQTHQTVNEGSDLENNNEIQKVVPVKDESGDAVSVIKEETSAIGISETEYEQPMRIGKGRRISRIPSDPNKNNVQGKITSPDGAIKRELTSGKNRASTKVRKEEKVEELDEQELPGQGRTFKRRMSRFGKRQMAVEKSESGSASEESKSGDQQKETGTTERQPVAKVEQPSEKCSESPQAVHTGKKRVGRPSKRKASEGDPQQKGAQDDEIQSPGSAGTGENAETSKKPRPSEFKAIDCELQYLIRLKGVNHKVVADRLTKLGCSSDQLIQQILMTILEKNGTDLLNSLFIESNKVKDTRIRLSWKPVMADHEVKIMQLILRLNSTVMPTLVNDFIVAGGKYIKKNRNVLISVSVSRVMAGLIRQSGDCQRLRVMLYDFLIGGTNGYPSVLVAVIGVWPAPMSKLDRRQSPNIVLDTMEFTIMAKLIGQRVKHSKVVQCLQNLLGWSEASISLIGMSQNLISKLMSAENQGYEELLACRLLLVGQSWEWINNRLILEILWPHLQSWVNSQNQATFTDPVLQNLLSLLGEAASKCPPHFTHSIEGLMKTLSALASGLPTIQVSENVTKTCLKALLQLSPFDPIMVAVTCINWVRDHRHDYLADLVLQHKIKTFTDFYKTQLQAIDVTVFNV